MDRRSFLKTSALGGGGTGGVYVTGHGKGGNGAWLTGGGGGGSRNAPNSDGGPGGAGGSGTVILSVPTADFTGNTTGAASVTTSGSNTIIKFITSGSYVA